MLGRLRIGPKLLLAPGAVLILLVLLSCGAYSALLRQNQSLEVIVLQRAANLRAAAELVSDAHHAHTQIYQLLTWINASFSATRTDALVAELHRRHALTARRFAALVKRTADGSAERRFIEQAEAAHVQYVKAVLDVIELSQADSSMSANAMWKAERAFEVVALRLYELAQLERELSERASDGAAAEFATVRVLMPAVIVASVVLSLLITMAVRRALLREVHEIGQAARDLANGDLTCKPRHYGSDEIAETSRALDASIRSLNATLRGILESARSIGSASRDITPDNAGFGEQDEARSGTLGQAVSSMASLEQVMAEVRALAQSSGEALREIESLVLGSAQAGSGKAHASAAGERMAELAASVARVGELVEQIGRASVRQARGLGCVSDAIIQMDQVSQHNSALVTQAAKAAEGLQEQAHSLFRAVAAFKLDEIGQEPPALPPPGGGKARLRLASKRE